MRAHVMETYTNFGIGGRDQREPTGGSTIVAEAWWINRNLLDEVWRENWIRDRGNSIYKDLEVKKIMVQLKKLKEFFVART